MDRMCNVSMDAKVAHLRDFVELIFARDQVDWTYPIDVSGGVELDEHRNVKPS